MKHPFAMQIAFTETFDGWTAEHCRSSKDCESPWHVPINPAVTAGWLLEKSDVQHAQHDSHD